MFLDWRFVSMIVSMHNTILYLKCNLTSLKCSLLRARVSLVTSTGSFIFTDIEVDTWQDQQVQLLMNRTYEARGLGLVSFIHRMTVLYILHTWKKIFFNQKVILSSSCWNNNKKYFKIPLPFLTIKSMIKVKSVHES